MDTDEDLGVQVGYTRVTFRKDMDDDLNTPVALAELQRLKSDVNKLLSQGLSTEARKIAREEFRSLGNVLGLFQLEKWQYVLKAEPGSYQIPDDPVALTHKDQMTDAAIEAKVAERNEARKQKNFKKADEIRQFLASHGIVIEDKPDGTSRWKR